MNPPDDAAVVRVPVTPMTASRSLRSEQVSQAILGTPVRVVERGPRWCRVQTPDEYEGWVPRRAIHDGRQEPCGDTAMVSDLWANLRPRPDSRLPSRLTAYISTRLGIAELEEGWVGLDVPGGSVSWVEAHRVRRGGPDAPLGAGTPEAVLATAQRFLGVPYLWGGCTPAGIDCSGFVQLVFGLHGIRLRRDTTEQVTQGQGVAFEALQPADVVFFGPRGPESERVTHVGLMLDGRRFIHARGGQCVKINGLDEDEWARRLAAARRLTP